MQLIKYIQVGLDIANVRTISFIYRIDINFIQDKSFPSKCQMRGTAFKILYKVQHIMFYVTTHVFQQMQNNSKTFLHVETINKFYNLLTW